MKRPSLEEIAKKDKQVARFLERRAAEKRNKPDTDASPRDERKRHHPYRENHVPETRDLGDEASAAIDRCVLG